MTIALPTCEAVDLRGMPQIVDGRMQWASPLPKDGAGVLILDEISSAAPDVQVAAHHIAWHEDGSDVALPKGWHLVMTGNRASHKTLYRPMSGPLRNRVILLDIESDADSWCRWAVRNAISPLITGF